MSQMSDIDYVLTWAVYLLSVVLICYPLWKLTSILPWATLRRLVRANVLTLLLVPCAISAEISSYAPAFIALAFELLAGKQAEWQGTAQWLLGVLAAVNLLIIIMPLFRPKVPAESSASV